MTHEWRERFDEWLEEVRYAVRALRRTPSFTLTAVLTAAVGIGAATAICSIATTLLLHPLPYDDADQLVHITEHVPADESPSGKALTSTTMKYEAFEWRRDHSKAFSSVAAYTALGATIQINGEAVRVTQARLSSSTFGMLRVGAQVGRLFADGDRDLHTAVISARMWSRDFARDPNVIGRQITIDGTPHAIVGVAPQRFSFPTAQTDVWTQYIAAPYSPTRIDTVDVVARLRPGVSLAQATAEANAIGNAFAGLPAPGEPDAPSPPRFDVRTLQEQLVGPVRPALRALMVAVGLVLLLICVNLASLVTARGATRQGELAIRRALGAGGARLFGQTLTESILVSLAAGLLGVLVAISGLWVVKRLAHVAMPAMYGGDRALFPGLDDVHVDLVVLSFTVLASVATGVISGFVPALRIGHAAAWPQTRGLSPGSTPAASRMRRAVLAAQLAMATMLMVGASLLIHSFVALAHVNLGYEPAHRLTFELVLPERGKGERLAQANTLTAQLARLPAVQAVGFTESAPLAELPGAFLLTPPGKSPEEVLGSRGEQYRANMVSPGYLRAIGARLIAGRWLDARDGIDAPRSLLINQSLASAFFGQQNPIGQTIGIGMPRWRVVGLVADVKSRALDRAAEPQAYVDPDRLNQAGREAGWAGFDATPMTLSYAVHTTGDPRDLVPAVRALVRQLDPQATTAGVMVMTDVVDSALAGAQFYAVLLALFAVVAGAIAAVGLYAWLTHAVVLRRRELGVRMALGATSRAIMQLVLRDAGFIALWGLAAGAAGAPILTGGLRQLLFGIERTSAVVVIEVIVLVLGVALLAAYAPARRATRVDPMTAIRADTL